MTPTFDAPAALTLLRSQRVPILSDTLYRRASEAGYCTTPRFVAMTLANLLTAGQVTHHVHQDGRSRFSIAG